jgi:hypothetical protein
MPRKRFQFDVALSFAGEDRSHAKELAEALVAEGLRVFYDEYEQAQLWGKDLYQHLQNVYTEKAKFCVIFASEAYARKLWTKHELKQAQARAFREQQEYLLPLRLDETKIPGVPETTGYVDLRKTTIQDVAEMLVAKVLGRKRRDPFGRDPQWDGSKVEFRGVSMASFWPTRIEQAQAWSAYEITRVARRIPYGEEELLRKRRRLAPCRDCGVLHGELHVPSCAIEECPGCGGQALGCECIRSIVKPRSAG